MEKNGIITLVIAVIVGVVMLSVITGIVSDKTSTISTTQKTINYSTALMWYNLSSPTDFYAVSSLTSVTNTSSTLTSKCNMTTLNSLPSIRCEDANIGATGFLNVTYEYSKSDYYTNSTARTLTGLFGTLFAIGILAVLGFSFIKKR